jgi:RimJ/RimL family protein N-acetyltransferase
MELVREEYGACIGSPVVQQMLACLDDRAVGFIQSYCVMGADPEWWTEETDPGARGIDQFLADGEQLGQGLGTEMVRQFLALLFEDPRVTKVQTDPAPDNARAIRAYEKAGFQRVGLVQTPDGAALLMVVRRAEHAAVRP